MSQIILLNDSASQESLETLLVDMNVNIFFRYIVLVSQINSYVQLGIELFPCGKCLFTIFFTDYITLL